MSPRPVSSRPRRAASAVGRYAARNSLGIVAILIASSGTAFAVSKLPENSVNSENIVFRGVHQEDLDLRAVSAPKIETNAVRGRQVDELSLDSRILQRRVSSSCEVGQSIRVVRGNGDVVCQIAGETSATGPAGGDLTGTYPSPSIADGVVGSDELADGAVGSAKLANGAVGAGQLANGSVGPGQLAAIPAGRAIQTAVQSFPSGGGPVRLQLDTAQYAQGVTFDNANDRFVVVTPGLYAISAELLWISDANGLRFLSINGSTGEYVTDTRQAVSGYATLQSVSTVQRFAAGTVIEAQGATTSASTTDVVSSGRGATLAVTYLGPASTGLARTPSTPVTRNLG